MINQAKDLKIEEYVRFIEPRPHNEIYLWINASDFLVLPTLSEGRPNVVIESMACKRTIIASNVDGVPELIDDNQTGILIPPKDSDAIAKNIIKLLKDEDLVEQLGINAYKKLLKMELNWENYAQKTKELYEELIKY